MNDPERFLRTSLANKASRPALGREVKTDLQVYRWLKNLGTARSEWETRLMNKLAAGLPNA